MTHCNSHAKALPTAPILFSSFGRRSVLADFAGGAITSDAGALLLRQVDRKLGLIDALDAVIPDPRNPALIIHRQSTMLRQRIFAIAMGYEDGNDHQNLRDDPLMQLVTERGIDPDQPLASPPTLCRLENRIHRRTLFDIARVLVETFIHSHKQPPKELILDFDATDDPIHGNQVNRFFHGYYDHYCFLPLYVFAGHHLLCAYLRPANIDPAKHAWAILALLVKRLRQVWPGVKIIFRGDSGFCRWKMLRWCEKHGVFYLVGLAKNSRLKEMARPLVEQAQRQFKTDSQKQRLFGQLDYAAYTWDQQRRVIVKAEHLEMGPNLRFIVTNLDGEPQPLYDQKYCQRGEAENRIKEQQLGLFADRTSCHGFAANQFRVLLSAAAYVLLQHLRQTTLAGTELAEAQVPTLRLKLLKIGGLLKRSARRIILHLAGGYPMQELFRRVAAHFSTA
jgi:DDE family transposase